MEFIQYTLCTIAIVVYAILAILSFVNGGLSPRSIYFSLVMFAGVGWMSVFFISTETFDQFVLVTRLGFLVLSILYYFMLLFSLALLRSITSKQFAMIAGVAGLLVVASNLLVFFMSSGLIITDFTYVPGNVEVTYSDFYQLLTVVAIYPLGFAALAAQIIAFRTAEAGRKKILRNTLMAYVVFVIFNVIFNVLASKHELHWIGSMSVLLLGPVFYGSVIQHSDDEL